ncbi:MAG: biotin/lipoyl-binding protein [Salinivirgaceae bacterium]|jgi:biotin carboxyl carrier protein|nr:biotin/lipoyl-binding protein [Salinivirgaceae bacterium]
MKKFEFTIKGSKYEVVVNDFDDNMANIEVNGTSYEVEVHKEMKKGTKTPKLIRQPVVSKPGEGTISKKDTVGFKVKAPLPGSIFKLSVAVGDTIKKGDVLLIMEAMKMENNIMSEKDGVVKSIKVAVGDAVLQEDVLMELE